MEIIKLERSGQEPLRFRGELLATANGQFVGTPPDKPNVDWFELSLYRIETGGFVVAVTYRRNLRGAGDECRIIDPSPNPAAWLQDYRERRAWLPMVIGFPPGMEHKQRRLEERLTRQFDTLVSAVLKNFPQDLTQGTQP